MFRQPKPRTLKAISGPLVEKLRPSNQKELIMKNRTLRFFILVVVLAGTAPSALSVGQRRRIVVRPHRVVVRRPVVGTKLVLRNGYPIRRVLPSTVVVRPARRVVRVNAPLVFLPRVAWTPTVAPLPPPDQLVWQD